MNAPAFMHDVFCLTRNCSEKRRRRRHVLPKRTTDLRARADLRGCSPCCSVTDIVGGRCESAADATRREPHSPTTSTRANTRRNFATSSKVACWHHASD